MTPGAWPTVRLLDESWEAFASRSRVVDQDGSQSPGPSPPVFDAILADNALAGLPPYGPFLLQGRILELRVRLMDAARILEIGPSPAGPPTGSRALPADGRFVTLEAVPIAQPCAAGPWSMRRAEKPQDDRRSRAHRSHRCSAAAWEAPQSVGLKGWGPWPWRLGLAIVRFEG